MAGEIHQPGPSREGFRIHVLVTEDRKVALQFGMPLTHVPMPPHIAFRMAQQILEKCTLINAGNSFVFNEPRVKVQAYDKQVLMEFMEASEIIFDVPYARDVALRLAEASAAAMGVPIR